MSTLSVTHGYMSASCEYTVTSTNTQTTISVSKYVTIIPEARVQLCRISVSGTLLYEWFVGTVTKSVLTKTFNRSTSASTVTLGISVSSEAEGSGDNSVNITIPALPSYTVSYNANGHGTAPSNQTKYYNTALTLRAGITATGYTFKRWNTKSDDTGTGYNASASYTGNAALALYAIWNRTVTYNANGGSGAPSAQTAIATSAITLSTTKPTYTGFTFKDWNTKSDGTGTTYASGGTYAANNASVTLYARWNHTVTFNANGGSGAPSAQTALKTSAITLSSTKPTRDGYRFKSWNTNSSGTGTTYNSGGTYAANGANITLYAVWEKLISAVTIGNSKAIRVASSTSTTESDEGEHAYITVPYTVTGPAAGNVTMSVTCTADTGTTPTVTLVTYQATKGSSTLSGTFVARASGCNIDIRYTFTVTVSATNTEVTQTSVTSTKNVILPTAYFVIDVKQGGKGIHFGGAAIEDGFHVSMPAYHNSNMTIIAPNSSTNMVIKNTDIERGVGTGGYQESSHFLFADKRNQVLGYLNGFVNGNAVSGIRMLAWGNPISGTNKYNGLALGVTTDGSAYVGLSGNATGTAAAWRNAIGAYPAAGGWATGDVCVTKTYDSNIKLKSEDVSTRFNATAPSANRKIGGLIHLDSNNSNNVVFYTETFFTTDRQQYTSFITRRYSGDASSNTAHGFYLRIDQDGTVRTTFPTTASRDAWRTGLNAVNKSGGDTVGKLTFNSGMAFTGGLTSCGTNMPFFLGLAQAYGDGGNVGYVTKDNMCAAIGALPTTGGTLSSRLRIQSSNLPDSAPSSTTQGNNYIDFSVNSGKQTAYAVCKMTSDGYCTLDIDVKHPSGSTYAYLRIGANQSGTNWIGVSNQAAWRSGIGAAAASSSSLRYKHDIKELSDKSLDAHKLYHLKAKQFVFNDDLENVQYDDMRGQTLPGFIAEDVAKIYPAAAITKDGKIESWDERRLLPAMLMLIQEQHEEIERLKQAIS